MPEVLFIALGSNRRHGRYGAPRAVLDEAVSALAAAGLPVVARSSVHDTSPVGPRQRRFANAVVAVTSDLPLAAILAGLQGIERAFGRRPARRWGPRVLDLDLIAAGTIATPHWRTANGDLTVPHRRLADREFVLAPLTEIAPGWRHPVLHLTARQLRVRLRRPKPRAGTDP